MPEDRVPEDRVMESIDAWLRVSLKRRYESTLSEPLPEELHVLAAQLNRDHTQPMRDLRAPFKTC